MDLKESLNEVVFSKEEWEKVSKNPVFKSKEYEVYTIMTNGDVDFDPSSHSYLLNDVKIPSVTGITSKNHFKKSAGMEEARKKGVDVHKELEALFQKRFKMSDQYNVYSGLSDPARRIFINYQAYKMENHFTSPAQKEIFTELRFISIIHKIDYCEAYCFAGTLDYMETYFLQAEENCRYSYSTVFDWKTGGAYQSYNDQIKLYMLATGAQAGVLVYAQAPEKGTPFTRVSLIPSEIHRLYNLISNTRGAVCVTVN